MSEVELYTISENTWLSRCCDEIQFRYTCKEHGEKMGCQFCEFDPDKKCEGEHSG